MPLPSSNRSCGGSKGDKSSLTRQSCPTSAGHSSNGIARTSSTRRSKGWTGSSLALKALSQRSRRNLTETPWRNPIAFSSALDEAARLTDVALGRLLPVPPGLEARVYEAMRYSALAPGKRLRPFLVLASSRLFGVARRCALQVAVAGEMVHAYSL